MTEEMINGIDVSGCEYYQIEANELYPKAQYCGSMRNTFCEDEPNCYFKQLKRLEQENAKLKNRLKTLDDEEFVYEVSEIEYNNFKKMNDYKQALEEIREIAENYDIPAEYSCEKRDCKECEICIPYGLGTIISKINEVLKDE